MRLESDVFVHSFSLIFNIIHSVSPPLRCLYAVYCHVHRVWIGMVSCSWTNFYQIWIMIWHMRCDTVELCNRMVNDSFFRFSYFFFHCFCISSQFSKSDHACFHQMLATKINREREREKSNKNVYWAMRIWRNQEKDIKH